MTSELSTLEPRTIDEAITLAKAAVASRLYSVASPEAALMILLTGRDLGLTASQSLRAVYVVNGKPVVSSDAMVAAIRRSGLATSWRVVESTVERCTITTKRAGEDEPESETFSMDDAKRAGLDRKDVWRAYPRDMLRHRCAAALARRVYPDVILGCYAPGELDEPAPAEVRTVERAPSPDRLTADDVLARYDADLAAGVDPDEAHKAAKELARSHKCATELQRKLALRERDAAEAKRLEAERAAVSPLDHPAITALVDELASAETPAAVVQVAREHRASLRDGGEYIVRHGWAQTVAAWESVGGPQGAEGLRAALRAAPKATPPAPATEAVDAIVE